MLRSARLTQVRVDVGRAALVCEVARTASDQARGLDGHEPLTSQEGMLFLFRPARGVTFHMSQVSFPIDIIFADAGGRVGKVVHSARPGETTQWHFPVAAAVVETMGGWARAHNVSVGDQVELFGEKLGTASRAHSCRRFDAQQTYNLLRTITEADVEPSSIEHDSLGPGYYSKEPLHDPSAPTRNLVAPDERFRGHDLPDAWGVAMDQPNTHWQDIGGYDPGAGPYRNPSTTDPAGDPDAGEPAAVRMGAAPGRAGPGPFSRKRRRTIRRRALEPGLVQDLGGHQVDVSKLVPDLIAGAANSDQPSWQPHPLMPGREFAEVSPSMIGQWCHTLGVDEAAMEQVVAAATSVTGMEALGRGFMLGDIADSAQVKGHGGINFLVLWRSSASNGNAEQTSAASAARS